MTARQVLLSVCLIAQTSLAQFSPALLQNKSYWSDGKSEIDFYNAEFLREGQKYPCELMAIFTPKFVDATSFSPLKDQQRPASLPVIEMNEFATVPRGLVTEQRSLRVLWRMDLMSTARISFVGTDGLGQIMKSLSETREANKVAWQYRSESYHEAVDLQQIDSPAGIALFYDELLLRVRTLDFSKNVGEAEIQVAPSLVAATGKFGGFSPAKVSWKIGDRAINVDLRHEAGVDHFVLDRDFPFLLREWQMFDGSHLKMKNSLRADFTNYMKNGDRERALKDPMLRHPD
ncbi:MAG: hypothetical protein JWO45_1809 [Spartobacteria bacterium]|nr:hypothetical protein [Spartobacteria bacterium]